VLVVPLVLTACGIGTRKSSSSGIALADYRDRMMTAACAPPASPSSGRT
jgi:hypothetical protein